MAKEVEFFEFDFEVLYGSGCDADVIGVAMVVVGDDCRGGFVAGFGMWVGILGCRQLAIGGVP